MGGFLHLMQNNLSNLVILIEIIHQPETQHDAYRLESINRFYFLTFLIGASMIADGNLKDATLLLCQFRRQFRLDAKTIAANGQCFNKWSEDDLVAGLHIGQVKIGQYIGNRGEHAICHAMPEIEDTAALS